MQTLINTSSGFVENKNNMKQKLTPQEDAKLFKNKIKKFFGVYQYVDTSLDHRSEYMRRDKSIEDNKLGYSILFVILLVFGLMVCAVMVAMWLVK